MLVLSAKKSTHPETMLDSIQELLTRMFELGRNFRAAAIWIDASATNVLVPLLETKWSSFEHWSLSSGDGKSKEVRMLDGEITPQAYLIGHTGLLSEVFMTPQKLTSQLGPKLA